MWAAAQQHPKVLQTLIEARCGSPGAHQIRIYRAALCRASGRHGVDADAPGRRRRREHQIAARSLKMVRGQARGDAGAGRSVPRRDALAPARGAGGCRRARQTQTFAAARRCSSRPCEATCRSRCSCWIAGQIQTSLMPGLLRFIGRQARGKTDWPTRSMDSSIRWAAFRIVRPSCSSSKRCWRTARIRICR